MTRRVYSLAVHFRRRFGTTARKIPLDAGSSCPNRDGAVSRGGCLFCNGNGSGTGLFHTGFDLAAQWAAKAGPILARTPGAPLYAYLQSFSNTHGPPDRLARLLDELTRLPGAAGICLGTRPDCLDAEKTALLAAARVPEVRLDLGLQSAHDATLALINRGHDAAAFARAARLAAGAGLWVTAHVIAGLPGETVDDFLATMDFLAGLPISGIKFHNLYVARGAPLAAWLAEGRFRPLSRREYVRWLVAGLPRVRPEVVVERLAADPAPGELLAPDWAGDKPATLAALHAALAEAGTWQGREAGAREGIPEWFAG